MMTNEQKLLVAAVAVASVIYFSKDSIVNTYKQFKQRGIRNNNPGNLVKTNIAWQGKVPHAQNTDSRFEQFVSPEYGIRAMFKDIKNDITSKGQNTVKKLITAYAPPFENNTQAYINVVAKAIGKGANDTITASDYPALLKAIIKHENGIQPYPDDLINKGIALA